MRGVFCEVTCCKGYPKSSFISKLLFRDWMQLMQCTLWFVLSRFRQDDEVAGKRKKPEARHADINTLVRPTSGAVLLRCAACLLMSWDQCSSRHETGTVFCLAQPGGCTKYACAFWPHISAALKSAEVFRCPPGPAPASSCSGPVRTPSSHIDSRYVCAHSPDTFAFEWLS